jgi:hypothetical protein
MTMYPVDPVDPADLVGVRDVYGRRHYVRRSDLDNPQCIQLPLFTRTGRWYSDLPRHRQKGGVTLHRANIAPPGSYQARRIELRRLDASLGVSYTIFDLPVVARRSSLRAMHRHCQRQGWRWRTDTSVYGGYYVAADGATYLLT